jgi:tetratricopeptide (TPR) repeat protein
MIALACCFAFLSLPGRVNAQFFDHSYAIVIGIDNYEFASAWKPLSYAVKDAKAMTDLLRVQGFTVIPLYNAQASKQAILSAMQDDLAPKLDSGDRVLVFFAGHGKAEELGDEQRGYIVPYDGKGSGSSLISMDEIQEQSSYMGKARHQLFILDSCYGGLLAATRDSIVDPGVPDYLKVVASRIARQVLTAGGKDQEVLDSGPNGHSIFMDALLEGILDGLADLNGDGYITFQELVAYITWRAHNKYQTPAEGVLPHHQGGEFLFKNPKGRGRPVSEISVPADAARRSDQSAMTTKQDLALGDTRFGATDGDSLIARYREAVRLKPKDAVAHVDLGVALGNKGDWDGEITEEREAIRLKPRNAEAHFDLGLALENKGDWDGEITEEREAIRLKPDLAEAHFNLGFALENKGDWEGAITEEREAIRLEPDIEGAHLDLGVALGHKGDWDGEVAEEREAIRLMPDDALAHYDLGLALGNKGDRDGEITEEREAIRLKPDLAEAHFNLGFALENKGDWEGAITEEREAIRLKPEDEYAHVNLGIALGNKGDWDGEIEEEREAIRLKPDFAEAHENLGVAFEQKGDTQTALAEYRRALGLNPRFADAQSRYDNLLKRTNSSPQ